ncbi:MAG: PAS domain-containing sensor histidine kinase [Bacteroidota bacterium]
MNHKKPGHEIAAIIDHLTDHGTHEIDAGIIDKLKEELDRNYLLIPKDDIIKEPTGIRFLADTAIDMVKLKSTVDIYQYVGEKLFDLFNQKALIFIVDYSYSTNTWELKHFEGLKNVQKISSLLGYDLSNLEGEIKTAFYSQLKRGKLTELPFDIAELTNGKISNWVGKQVKEMLSINRLYCIPFKKNDQIIGNITIIPRTKNININKPLVETFIGQTANFISRINSKNKLLESEKKYRAVFDIRPDAICIISSDYTISDVNTGFTKMTGYSKKELLHHNLKTLNLFIGPHFPFDQTNQLTNYHTLIRTKEGRKKHVLLSAQQIIINHQNHTLSVITDISSLKTKQEELEKALKKAEESDRLKSAFLTNINHEVRTPMNGIIGFTELLKNSNPNEKEYYQFLEIIENSGKRLLTLLNNLVDLSLIQAKEIGIRKTRFNMNSVLDSLSYEFKDLAENKHIQLQVKKGWTDAQSYIYTDQVHLVKIFKNLLNNAFKYTNAGNIEFGYLIENNIPVFFVSDTGIGIAKDIKSKIFDYFRQGDMNMNRKYEGAGLGLSLSKAYVNILDGNIWVKSEPKKGTTFYFTIKYT